MNYSEIKTIDIANGTGCRTSVFVSGCDFHCKGCFNKEAWDFNAGEEFTTSTIDKILSDINRYYMDGLSILGGEPLHPKNRKDVFKLIKFFRNTFFNTKTIWLWTGYTYEELLEEINALWTEYTFEELLKEASSDNDAVNLYNILRHIDILVDGPFKEDEKDLTLKFRGSRNQRIIDMKRTLAQPTKLSPVIWTDDELFETHGWPGRDD